ncbi:hypothetical protein XF14_28185 [Burkholderia gladioli]|nr:hypothetical protein XF14_28185 [Burkholderia gladioli]
MWAQNVDDGSSVARRFKHHMIGATQFSGEALQLIAFEPGTTAGMQHTVFEICDLGHGARTISRVL